MGLAHQVIHGIRLVDGIYSAEKMNKLRENSLLEDEDEDDHRRRRHYYHSDEAHNSASNSPPMGSPDHPYPQRAHHQLQQFHSQRQARVMEINTNTNAHHNNSNSNNNNDTNTNPNNNVINEAERNHGNDSPDPRKRGSGSLSPTRRYQESTFASRANERDYVNDNVVHASLTSYNMKLHSRNPRNSPRSVLANKGLAPGPGGLSEIGSLRWYRGRHSVPVPAAAAAAVSISISERHGWQ